MVYGANGVDKERLSRAKWAKALAKRIHDLDWKEESLSGYNASWLESTEKELLRQAEVDAT